MALPTGCPHGWATTNPDVTCYRKMHQVALSDPLPRVPFSSCEGRWNQCASSDK